MRRLRTNPRRGKGLILLTLLLLGYALSFSLAWADDIRIGVLALRGEAQAMQTWEPLAEHLQAKLPERNVEVIPLDFDEIHLAVRREQIDFVVANPAFYVDLEMRYGVSPVVTMIQRSPDGLVANRFGGVLLTRADRDDIQDIEDLKGTHFAAVDDTSFGGWLTGQLELEQAGLNTQRDFSELSFVGTHDAVIEAILSGEVDAGTVRTGTIEAMVAEGKIDRSDLHVLARKRPANYPFLLSTELYPEWPLARIAGVPEDLAIELAVALMRIPPDSPAALQSGIAGWTLPLNYQPVHDNLRALRAGPYEHLAEVTIQQVFDQYKHWLFSAILMLILAWILAAYLSRLNGTLKTKQKQLQELNDTLEERVEERTERIEHLLGREHYLRAIVQTVADVNQIIITSEDARQMLKSACDRLVGHRDYRFAWAACVDDDGKLTAYARSYGASSYMQSLIDVSKSSIAQMVIDNAEGELTRKLPEHERLAAVIALPLRADAYTAPFGALCVYTEREDGFDTDETEMLEQLCGDLGFAIHAFSQQDQTLQLQLERIRNYEQTIYSMVDLIEKRDTYTAGHSRRVAYYSVLIAQRLGLPAKRIEQLERAAILHDIGKIVIPDSVLLKPGRLTDLEFDLIKQHVRAGYETLSKVAMYQDLAEGMLHHHERLDGSGYPQGLKGEDIPLEGRIMAVADSFDAMTSDRIYKTRMSVASALTELQSLAGQFYDPKVVKAATEVLADITPPSAQQQMPVTAVEKQRFAYFFNDQLTGMHNMAYLEFVLRDAPNEEHRYACLVELHHFGQFNTQHSWRAGDELLCAFAAHLRTQCPGALIFRVQGDDFVILGPDQQTLCPEQLRDESPLTNTPVTVEVSKLTLDHAGIEQLKTKLNPHPDKKA